MGNFNDKYVQEQFKGADGAPAAFRNGLAPAGSIKEKCFPASPVSAQEGIAIWSMWRYKNPLGYIMMWS